MKTFMVLVIHGGAGNRVFTSKETPPLKATLKKSLKAGADILKAKGSSEEAVIAAVKVLEDSPWFNAGKGSVLNNLGFAEMDAALMFGPTQRAGAVTCVTSIKNPILAAQEVMNNSPHVLLSGIGAENFASLHKLETRPREYFITSRRKAQLVQAQKKGAQTLDHSPDTRETVGAVALDSFGELAAATSTGGLTNKYLGRVSDTSLIGAGTYANSSVAISCTGTGDVFIRACAAVRVADRHKVMSQKSLDRATQSVMELVKELGGEGGLIAVDKRGNLSLSFNTRSMFRGMWQPGSNKVWI